MNISRLNKSKPVYGKPIRILLTGGGSGGPTQPLIALADRQILELGYEHFFQLASRGFCSIHLCHIASWVECEVLPGRFP